MRSSVSGLMGRRIGPAADGNTGRLSVVVVATVGKGLMWQVALAAVLHGTDLCSVVWLVAKLAHLAQASEHC